MATCTLTGKLLFGDDTPYAGAHIYAIPYDSPAIIQGTDEVIAAQPVSTMSTSTGEFILDLIKNVRFTINIPAVGFKKTIIVPDQTTEVLWNLTDIFETGDPTPNDTGEDNW